MRWSVVLILLGVSTALGADDGSWGTSRDAVPSAGALYTPAGTVPVVMEKEYLELSDAHTGATRAVFQFHNSARQGQTVECAFPIVLKFPFHTGISLAGGRVQAGDGEAALLDFGPGQDNKGHAQGLGDSDAPFWLSNLGVKLTDWDPAAVKFDDEEQAFAYGGHYLRADEYPSGRKQYPAADLAALFHLTITQNGAPVELTGCVVDFGSGPGLITLHFRHSLSIAPLGNAVLEVHYEFDALSNHDQEGGIRYPPKTDTWTWNYILETASSWQGPLGHLVLSVPLGVTLPEPWSLVGIRGDHQFFEVKNWKPGPKDNLSLSWSESTRDYPGLWADPDVPPLESEPLPEDTVHFLAASSQIADKADAFLPWGVLKQASFAGSQALDGHPETAWGVRTPHSGVGEWIRFQLNKPVGLVAVENGYLRSTVDYPPKKTWSFYQRNNRVKTLELVDASGQVVASLNLDDHPGDPSRLQYFNVNLAPGVYQARIQAVYRGSEFDDTCLGELVFFPGAARGFAALDADPFFATGQQK